MHNPLAYNHQGFQNETFWTLLKRKNSKITKKAGMEAGLISKGRTIASRESLHDQPTLLWSGVLPSWSNTDCIPTSRVEESTTAVRDLKSYTTKYCTVIHNHPQPRATTIPADKCTRNGTRPSCKVLDRFVEAFGSSAQHQLQPSKTSAEITSVITTFKLQ